MFSTSLWFYKYFKIQNIIFMQNDRDWLNFGLWKLIFSYNFIISAEFWNDLSADVDQINPKKSHHPKRWLHMAGNNPPCTFQSAWNMERPNVFLIIKNDMDRPVFILPGEVSSSMTIISSVLEANNTIIHLLNGSFSNITTNSSWQILVCANYGCEPLNPCSKDQMHSGHLRGLGLSRTE